jgi:hypothetical protein
MLRGLARGVDARMHQRLNGVGYEAVVNEEILRDAEL